MSGMIVLALLLAAPAPAPIADERRLSPGEVERILEEAARKAVTATRTPERVIEGEVGVSIGTGGHRALFGTAVVPVGNDATAIISVGGEDDGRPRQRPR